MNISSSNNSNSSTVLTPVVLRDGVEDIEAGIVPVIPVREMEEGVEGVGLMAGVERKVGVGEEEMDDLPKGWVDEAEDDPQHRSLNYILNKKNCQ